MIEVFWHVHGQTRVQLDSEDEGTTALQNITLYQTTWHNIPENLNLHSNAVRISNLTKLKNIQMH